MRALILLGLATAVPCSGQSVRDVPWMTGARLLEMVSYPPETKSGLELSRSQYATAERARLYIEGVHDATEGKAWCYSERYRPGPDALREQVEMALRAMPPAQLQRNAADLIVDVWARHWPCKSNKSAR